jgi:hypothetical protein
MNGIGLKGLIDYTRQKLDENYTILETLNDAQTLDIAAIKTDIINILQELELIKVGQPAITLEIKGDLGAKVVSLENKLNTITNKVNELENTLGTIISKLDLVLIKIEGEPNE